MFVNFTSFTSKQPLSAQLYVGNSNVNVRLRCGFVWRETEFHFVICFMGKYWPDMLWKALWWYFAVSLHPFTLPPEKKHYYSFSAGLLMFVKCICILCNFPLEVLVSSLVIWRNNEKDPIPSSWTLKVTGCFFRHKINRIILLQPHICLIRFCPLFHLRLQ